MQYPWPCTAKLFFSRSPWRLISLLVLLAATFTACQIQEGPGGSAAITGRVLVHDYNADFSQFQGTYYAPEEEVFIVYGDAPVHGDDMETHLDGRFRFDYLRKGTYTIYTYSKDSTGTEVSGVVPVSTTVEITSKRQEIDLGEIVILK